eukprot:TRINITY_DN12635_c0_g1_i1.p1 TRINITY_DN12635_c0_g1~~TRINITY_DN12635_c0_g1_i1.p1  ORF type:complete len:299 (-),score=35.95 TRINITY_DN12635_c0_g1_i1:222-1118(-)
MNSSQSNINAPKKLSSSPVLGKSFDRTAEFVRLRDRYKTKQKDEYEHLTTLLRLLKYSPDNAPANSRKSTSFFTFTQTSEDHVTNCQICSKSFSSLFIKTDTEFQCPLCKYVVCTQCSQKAVPLANNATQTVRVCANCSDVYERNKVYEDFLATKEKENEFVKLWDVLVDIRSCIDKVFPKMKLIMAKHDEAKSDEEKADTLHRGAKVAESLDEFFRNFDIAFKKIRSSFKTNSDKEKLCLQNISEYLARYLETMLPQYRLLKHNYAAAKETQRRNQVKEHNQQVRLRNADRIKQEIE